MGRNNDWTNVNSGETCEYTYDTPVVQGECPYCHEVTRMIGSELSPFCPYCGQALILVRCSKCGKSDYIENYRISTLMYYPPHYVNGVNVNPDRNKETVSCTCCKCGEQFNY